MRPGDQMRRSAPTNVTPPTSMALLRFTSPALWRQVEPKDVQDGGYAIPPADFLPLLICAARIRDGYLPDPRPCLRQPGRNFWLEPEPVAGKHQRLHQRSPHHLVA